MNIKRTYSKVKLRCPKCGIETWVDMEHCDICHRKMVKVKGENIINPHLMRRLI